MGDLRRFRLDFRGSVSNARRLKLFRATYKASWGTPVKSVTTSCILILIGLPIFKTVESGTLTKGNFALLLKTLLPSCLLIIIAALFLVRGYILTKKQLIVKRLFWKNRVNLSKLVSAEFDSQAMLNSWRVLGNGGFFSITGLFWNQKLGLYRAFVTNEKNSIVLKFTDKVIVITPDNLQDMLTKLTSLLQIKK